MRHSRPVMVATKAVAAVTRWVAARASADAAIKAVVVGAVASGTSENQLLVLPLLPPLPPPPAPAEDPLLSRPLSLLLLQVPLSLGALPITLPGGRGAHMAAYGCSMPSKTARGSPRVLKICNR